MEEEQNKILVDCLIWSRQVKHGVLYNIEGVEAYIFFLLINLQGFMVDPFS